MGLYLAIELDVTPLLGYVGVTDSEIPLSKSPSGTLQNILKTDSDARLTFSW